jgi:AcrR family transcriptional regulator
MVEKNRIMAASANHTYSRLLKAASKLFADKGFDATKVAEICRSARANIAAVNYHFGSKENLYREAWRYAHAGAFKAFPPDGGVRPDASAEDRLRGRIWAALQRALAGDGAEFRIMAHEMANPTGLLQQVVHDTIAPLREAMREILSELLDGRADEDTLRLCEISVISPWMQVVRRRHVRRHEGPESFFTPEKLEYLVDHFTAFALAGVREIRERIEGESSRPPEPVGGGQRRET